MKKLLLVFIALLFYAGCSKAPIEDEKFVTIYADILIAQDSLTVNAAKKQVFDRYKISEKDYRKTVEFYNKNPRDWDIFFDKVIAHIEKQKKNSSSSKL